MFQRYIIILSRNNTYCSTLNDKDYAKLKQKYNLEFTEMYNKDNVKVVKHQKYHSTKLRFMIWGIWEKVNNET